MIPTSSYYKKSIYNQTRKVKAVVNLDFETLEDDTPPAITSSDLQQGSYLGNLLIPRTPYAESIYSSFEENLPRYTMNYYKRDQQITSQGFFTSSNLCDDNGNFGSPPWVTYTYPNDKIISDIQFRFVSNAYEGYPTNMTVSYYSSQGFIKSVIVTDITSDRYTAQHFEDLTEVNKITFTINQWSSPRKRCRITEIIVNTSINFDGRDVILVEETRTGDFTGVTLPSSGLRITLSNPNLKFSVLKPEGFYQYIRKNLKLKVTYYVEHYHAFEDNYTWEKVTSPIYYLDTWQSTAENHTFSLVATDLFSHLHHKIKPNQQLNNDKPLEYQRVHALWDSITNDTGVFIDYVFDLEMHERLIKKNEGDMSYKDIIHQSFQSFGFLPLVRNETIVVTNALKIFQTPPFYDDKKITKEQMFGEPEITYKEPFKEQRFVLTSLDRDQFIFRVISPLLIDKPELMDTGKVQTVHNGLMIDTDYLPTKVKENQTNSLGQTNISFNIKFQGNPSIQPFDVIEIADNQSNIHKVIVQETITVFDGALRGEITATKGGVV